jgi:hypothetical protein
MLPALSNALSAHPLFWTAPDRTEDGIAYLDVYQRDREDALGAAMLMADLPKLRTDNGRPRPASEDPLGIVLNDTGELVEFASVAAAVAWLTARVRWAAWRGRFAVASTAAPHCTAS